MGALLVPIIIFLAIIILMIVSFWKIYVKAGEPGWACIIPIYNIIVMLKIAGKPWWWLFLLCIPIVNIIFAIMMYNGLSKNFGQGAGFTVGLILLGIVFWPMLAFGDYQYNAIAVAAGKDQPLDAGIK